MYHIGVVLIYDGWKSGIANSHGRCGKLELFKLLCDIGFKEIEIGFPSAAQTEFDFARKLIEDKLVPEGVALQVLTQSREHLIKRSLESLQGARKAIVHLYNSTSPLQRRVTFGMSKEEIKDIAVSGVRLVKKIFIRTARYRSAVRVFTRKFFRYRSRLCT